MKPKEKRPEKSCKSCRFGNVHTEYGKISVNKQVVEPRRTEWYCNIMVGDDRRHPNTPLADLDPCHLWVEGITRSSLRGEGGGCDASMPEEAI